MVNCGCPSGTDVYYRKVSVSDATSGLSWSDTNYYIGTYSGDADHHKPVTGNKSTSGAECFCSGTNNLYASWTLCDVAGNCKSDSKSWTK